MSRLIKHVRTLMYYDGIQLFEAEDRIGGHYVGSSVDDNDNGEIVYLLVGASPKDLQAFRLGTMDLLTLIKISEQDPWFVGTLSHHEKDIDFVVTEERTGSVPAEYLPGPGLTLSYVFQSDDTVVDEAKARSTLALSLAIESPIPSDEHRIRANDLSGLLYNFQSLLKNAYRKSVAKADRSKKKALDGLSPLLDVAVPAKTGSFKVVLVPAQLPSLFGGFDVTNGLDVVDYLFATASDPEATLERLRSYSGHTASSFVRLIRFMVEQNLAVKYTWATPDRAVVVSRTVTQREAVPLLELLSSTENLATERFTIAGRLTKIDVNSESWRLDALDSSDQYMGKVREGVTLAGLTAGELYTLECEEEIEEIAGTGREIRTIYLVDAPRPVKQPN